MASHWRSLLDRAVEVLPAETRTDYNVIASFPAGMRTTS